jgi:hypothetical protein
VVPWIIDIGFPGPDRGEGGRYLIIPPGYDGPLPDSGFHVARSKTMRVLYAARAYLVKDDPKPVFDMIKKTMKIYPYTPGGFGTSIATALEGKVKLEVNPPIPETKFVIMTVTKRNSVITTDTIPMNSGHLPERKSGDDGSLNIPVMPVSPVGS